VPLSPLERHAAFAYAATMHRRRSKSAAAKEDLGVTWTHLSAVLDEIRPGSDDLRARFAAYIEKPVEEVWSPKEAAGAAA
jgi:hypothetical protein